MIKFFRKIRYSLLSKNKTGKYFKYAIGEIVLVVIGILIALQINNWNEKRKATKNFEFGLKQLYTQIQVEFYNLDVSQNRLQFQLNYIDSILKYPQSINPQRLPGILQILDYSGLSAKENIRELLSPYLKLNPNNEMQNKIALEFNHLFYQGSAINIITSESPNFQEFNPTVFFYDYLKDYNVRLRFPKTVENYIKFIKPPSEDYYSEDEIKSVKELIKSPSFISDLKTIRALKNHTYVNIPDIQEILNSSLTFLEDNYPDAVNNINYMEIIGDGTLIGNWGSIGIPMNYVENGIFEIETELFNGHLKFRTDSNWTFDWGAGLNSDKDLQFKGENIPVNKGFYKITININEPSYSVIPIKN